MTVVVDHRFTSLAQIEAVVEKMGANVAQLTLMRGESGAHDSINFSFVRSVPKAQLLEMMSELRLVEGVQEIRI